MGNALVVMSWQTIEAAVVAAVALVGIHVSSQSAPAGGSRLVAEAWPEANALFQHDPRWIGGDATYSVDLGKGRVLWLFGDSFIATSSARSRRESVMVRNSIGIQVGYDVNYASVKFNWKESKGTPTSFFDAPAADRWYWPAHGSMVGRRLILFLWEVRSSTVGLGFAVTGWRAIAVENPAAPPENWAITRLAAGSRIGISMGSAVVVDGGFLYAYATGRASPDQTYLARWPRSCFSGDSPGSPEWFSGTGGWIPEKKLSGEPAPVADVNQSEFSVYRVPGISPYLLIQTDGFGPATLAFQTSSGLTSEYSGRRTFYVPPERSKPKVMIYSGKMHPMLTSPGYDVVASYSTNSFDFATLLDDMTLYFPRFVRARWVH